MNTQNEDCENLNCVCDDPNNLGFKLYECGTQLCKFLKGDIPHMGIRIVRSEETETKE